MTSKSRLSIPAAPRLPSTAVIWEPRFMDDYSRMLRLYFNQLDNTNSSLLGTRGGRYLNNPYGSFSNTATQPVTAANTPYVVALNTADAANGVSLAANKMTVEQTGVYNCQFSLQFENTTASIVDVWVWLRKNGVDVPGTASTWAITSSHGGTNGYMIGACNFFVSMTADDYLELAVAADGTGVNIEAYAASASPFTRPSIPSSVVTLSFVSAPSS